MSNEQTSYLEVLRFIDTRHDELRQFLAGQVAQINARLDRVVDVEKSVEGDRVRVAHLQDQVAALEDRVLELERTQPQTTLTTSILKWVAATLLAALAAGYGGALFTNNGGNNGREGKPAESAARAGS